MNEEEAIERVEKYIKSFNGNALDCVAIETVLNLIQKQQAEIEDCKKCILRDEVHDYINEIKKKDKIISLMAERLTTPIHSKEWVIDYYKRKVE